MKSMRAIAVIGASVMSFTSACGGEKSPVDTQPGSDNSTQIANPASVFCVEQGGTLEIVDEQLGQVGYCNLPDGRRVEEWDFFYEQNPPEDVGLPGDSAPDSSAPADTQA